MILPPGEHSGGGHHGAGKETNFNTQQARRAGEKWEHDKVTKKSSSEDRGPTGAATRQKESSSPAFWTSQREPYRRVPGPQGLLGRRNRHQGCVPQHPGRQGPLRTDSSKANEGTPRRAVGDRLRHRVLWSSGQPNNVGTLRGLVGKVPSSNRAQAPHRSSRTTPIRAEGQAVEQLSTILLWMALASFPVKLQKAAGGKSISWRGVQVALDDDTSTVVVSISRDKIDKLKQLTDKFLTRPVIGRRELRSYAGAPSFVPSLIPYVRPFLSSLCDDGAHPKGNSGRLVHVRSCTGPQCGEEPSLRGSGAVEKRAQAFFPPRLPVWLEGTLRMPGELKEAFSVDNPSTSSTNLMLGVATQNTPRFLWHCS